MTWNEQRGRPLTGREQQVLDLVAQGMANRRIARTLGISESTVKNHLRAVFAKLGVTDRTQAAVLAVRTGLAPRHRHCMCAQGRVHMGQWCHGRSFPRRSP
ncbi:response regulator transcription factor [Streptomyces sp. NBC_01537]|uniref:response regulator transcription factor n=1 Tax=Streptomyces sp. NBC_01537 TaxID=2903896 RepID=UPI003866123B